MATKDIIVAIIVTYNPDTDILLLVISKLYKQVNKIIIVDNYSCDELVEIKKKNIIYIKNSSNIGVAAAQNLGINKALEIYADYILLMDQDSIAEPNLVKELLNVYKEQSVIDTNKIAAVGARYPDGNSKDGLSQFAKYKYFTHYIIPFGSRDTYVETDFLMSSGMLIKADILYKIGLMDESLFIDYVDVEWSLRAKSHGYLLCGARNAVIKHNLGDSQRRLWFLRWRLITCHKPFRYYYISRNIILLNRRDYISRLWRYYYLYRIIQIIILYGVLFPPRTKHLCMILLGIWHALRGKTGIF